MINQRPTVSNEVYYCIMFINVHDFEPSGEIKKKEFYSI